GESEKNLVRVFHEANKNNCVLVFDEAEALFGNRLSEHNHSDRTYNYMTNILMQQMERFDGIVILTTNHNLAMDEAFDRRIMLKLKFEIPEAEERSKIWRTLIPHKTPLAPDVDFNTLGAKFRLSGGEIKNAILNAIKECAYQGEHVISMAILTNCAEKEIANARVQREKKNIGFNID
ncbi:MAG: ATP-binding protein, partial [candidate division WOR-3 bacterium]